MAGLDGPRHLVKIKDLSGGQKARVVLASIALQSPHILVRRASSSFFFLFFFLFFLFFLPFSSFWRCVAGVVVVAASCCPAVELHDYR